MSYLFHQDQVGQHNRHDRLGSPHANIVILNMSPEGELESRPHLAERLTSRILTIDSLGLLDASILGESVHPRTFNTLRRIRDEDGAVLDEEEARAELAGPEVRLKQLRDMLNREAGQSVVHQSSDARSTKVISPDRFLRLLPIA